MGTATAAKIAMCGIATVLNENLYRISKPTAWCSEHYYNAVILGEWQMDIKIERLEE